MSICAQLLMTCLLSLSAASADTGHVAQSETAYVTPLVSRADSMGIAQLRISESNHGLFRRALHQWETRQSLLAKWLSPGTLVPTAAAILSVFGFLLQARRNRREERRKWFETYREQAVGGSRPVGERKAAIVELGHLSGYAEFERWVINYLTEAIQEESDPDVLRVVRDELIRIGAPALQTLVNKHRESFPVGDWTQRTRYDPGPITWLYTYRAPPWLPLKPEKTGNEYEVNIEALEADSLAFTHSRDAICAVLATAKFGNLARPRREFLRIWNPFGSSRRRWLRWFLRFSWLPHVRFGILFRRRWLDGNGLNEIALPGATIYDTDLRYSEIMSAQFGHAKIAETTFAHANLGRTQMNDADLNGVAFDSAEMSQVQLNRAKYFVVRLRRADVANACFDNAADVPWLDFTYANLTHATFRSANLSAASMQFTQVQWAVFEDATGCELRGFGSRNWTGVNWWDDAKLTPEQEEWFSNAHPERVEGPVFLCYWKRFPRPFEGYTRRRWFGRLVRRLHVRSAQAWPKVAAKLGLHGTE